jgi:hypothetical protein
MATCTDPQPYGSEPAVSSIAPRFPAALSATAWSSRGDLKVADWSRQGRWLGALGRGCGWWIGDWMRYGNARYGERYKSAAAVTGYDVKSLMNMAYVAGRFDVARRRGSLSFSHHAELAALAAEDQDLWLDRAEAGDLSVRALRYELRKARGRMTARKTLAEARKHTRDSGASNGNGSSPVAGEFFPHTGAAPGEFSSESAREREAELRPLEPRRRCDRVGR